MFTAHDIKDNFRFKEVADATKELRRDLLNPEEGILPRIEEQTKKHNGRLTKLEKIMWVVGTAVVVLGVTNSGFVKIIAPLL